MFGRWRGVLQCGAVLPGSRASLSSSSSPSVSIRGAQLETLEIRFKFEQAARKCPSPKHFLKFFFRPATRNFLHFFCAGVTCLFHLLFLFVLSLRSFGFRKSFAHCRCSVEEAGILRTVDAGTSIQLLSDINFVFSASQLFKSAPLWGLGGL